MNLKEKIQKNEPTIGMHVSLTDVASARIAGLSGYDFIWVDLEHTYLPLEQLQNHIYAIQLGGADVIVRVPQHDLTYTKKVMEMGPNGVIFPMLRSAEEVREVVGMSLYPPYGTRGFGPQSAVNFGFRDNADYVAKNHLEFCRFIQIEHIDAVERIEEILDVPYIDGYIFGPCDLSGSIGQLLNVFGDDNVALMKKTIAAVHARGKYVGVSTGDTSDATLQRLHDLGIDMISAGADFTYIQQMALANRKNMERIHKNIQG